MQIEVDSSIASQRELIAHALLKDAATSNRRHSRRLSELSKFATEIERSQNVKKTSMNVYCQAKVRCDLRRLILSCRS
jgi:hypothetical protein